MSIESRKMARRLSTKKWRENNPDKIREYRKLYEQREKVKEYRKKYRKVKGTINAKRWRNNNPDKSRESSLKYAYGITLEEYNQLFVNQNGVCAICKEKQVDGRNLCVDHDHKTHKVRGLLCLDCNSGIGHLKDSESLLLEAIKYLNNSSK